MVLSRMLQLALSAYVVSGVTLIPIFIIASAMHLKIKRSLIPTMIGWGAAALVLVLYLAALID